MVESNTNFDTQQRIASSIDAPPSTPAPLLVDANGVGQLLDICRAQVWKMLAAGRLPKPVYLTSRSPRWSVVELQQWIAANCPDQQTWEKLKGGRK